MHAAGRSPKEVKEQLGHSTIAMTLDTYTHLFDQNRDEAAEAMALGYTRSLEQGLKRWLNLRALWNASFGARPASLTRISASDASVTPQLFKPRNLLLCTIRSGGDETGKATSLEDGQRGDARELCHRGAALHQPLPQ